MQVIYSPPIKMARNKKKFPYWLSIVLLLLAGILSWSFYNVLNTGVKDMLVMFNITNFYLQNLIIISVILVILFLVGFKMKSVLNKLIK